MVVDSMNEIDNRSSADAEDNSYNNKRNRFDSKFNLRILVASRNAGAIIGKRGDNIKELRKGFEGHILIIDSDGPEKILSVCSSISNVCEALVKIIPCFEDYQEHKDSEFECEIRMLIHQSQVGCIIGQQGSRIKEIREKAAIKLFEKPCPMSTDKVAQLKATPSKVAECVGMIYEFLQKAPPIGTDMPYDPHNYDEYSVQEYGGFSMSEGVSNKSGHKGGKFIRNRGSPYDRENEFRGRDNEYRGMNRGMRDRDYNMDPYMRGMGRRPVETNPMNYDRRFGRNDDYDMHYRNDGFDYGRDKGFDNYGRDKGFDNYGREKGFDNYGRMGRSSERNVREDSNFSMNSPGRYDSYDSSNGKMFGTANPISTQVTVSNDMAGSIIGNNGSNIREIKNKSGANIHIAESEGMSNERIVTIKGTEKQIQAAQYLMQNCVKSGRSFQQY